MVKEHLKQTSPSPPSCRHHNYPQQSELPRGSSSRKPYRHEFQGWLLILSASAHGLTSISPWQIQSPNPNKPRHHASRNTQGTTYPRVPSEPIPSHPHQSATDQPLARRKGAGGGGVRGTSRSPCPVARTCLVFQSYRALDEKTDVTTHKSTHTTFAGPPCVLCYGCSGGSLQSWVWCDIVHAGRGTSFFFHSRVEKMELDEKNITVSVGSGQPQVFFRCPSR